MIAIASLFSKSSFMIGVMRRMSVPTIMGEDTAHTHTHTHTHTTVAHMSAYAQAISRGTAGFIAAAAAQQTDS
eukprot:COSAG03_NODE_545_length_7019_cov_13.821795_7_plen_73_part_00